MLLLVVWFDPHSKQQVSRYVHACKNGDISPLLFHTYIDVTGIGGKTLFRESSVAEEIFWTGLPSASIS